MANFRDQLTPDSAAMMQEPDDEEYMHECYYCGTTYFDRAPPTAKDDCGGCDDTSED